MIPASILIGLVFLALFISVVLRVQTDRITHGLEILVFAVREATKEDPRAKLSDEILSKLKVRAVRDMTRHIATEDLTTYTYGLQDGETMTALWLLGEIQKETK